MNKKKKVVSGYLEFAVIPFLFKKCRLINERLHENAG